MVQDNGQVNLDCINNVSHIGHKHSKYVQNLQTQLAILNTNSRFIYESLNNALNKLLKKLPEELSVVTFCNSGTEANDLAMQLGQIYTKKKGIICLQAASHGISKHCMNVSPYKWNSNFKPSPDVIIAKSPCTYRSEFADDVNFSKRYAEYLNSVITEDTGVFIAELPELCWAGYST